MQFIYNFIARYPRLETILTSIYHAYQGIPRVSHSEITKELLRECIGKQDPTILDIGCNDGTHTLWFLEIFENPKIFCFEPDPRAAARFKRQVGQRSNVTLFENALSGHNGDITFYQSGGQFDEESAKIMAKGWDRSGSIKPPLEHLKYVPSVTFDHKITVKTSTLDTWCSEQGIESIDLMWMDVQGAEIDVFQGGRNTLTKTRFIYTEYSNIELYKGQYTLKQLLKCLSSFKPLIRYPYDILLSNNMLRKNTSNG
ncbi:2-O-methyltransferase NoeI [Geobacter sp. AOG1]|nr:2-O-methyltransferase NoeI [Geobacter sp. AOG1]